MSRVLLALVVLCLALVAASRWNRSTSRSSPLPVPEVVVAATSSGAPATSAPETPPTHPPLPMASQSEHELGVVRTPVLAQRALLEARRRFQYSVRATYLDSVFSSPDSVIRRWPDAATIRVVIPRDSVLPERVAAVEAALRTWETAGAGVRFSIVADTTADVRIRWVERFDGDSADTSGTGVARTGWAEMEGDGHGVIVRAVVTLARLHHTRVLEREELEAVAVHEFGHVLGLPHSPDRRDVMYPTVQVAGPSARDRATLLLLYGLPAGPLRIQ